MNDERGSVSQSVFAAIHFTKHRQTNWSPLAEGTWGAVGHAGAPARRGLGGAVRSALARGVRAAPPRRLPGAGSLLAASGVTSTAQAGGAHEAFRAMARPALGGAAHAAVGARR